MSKHAVMPLTDYINACNTVREKTGDTDVIKSGDLPQKIEGVYSKGYAEGEVVGQQAERDSFWDVFQNNGKARIYYYAFAYARFNDTNYNPKYPIYTSTSSTAGQHMFSANTVITDTKVPIILNGTNATGMFNGATKLKTIRELRLMKENATFSSAFTDCAALENITITGTISSAFDISDSPNLTDESIDSIVTALKDLTGVTALTLKVNTTVYNKMVKNGKDALVTAKNWALVKA